MVHVQFRRAVDEPLHRLRVERRQRLRVALDLVEESRVANERHLHGLDVARALVPIRQRGEQIEVVDDGEGRRKRADEILLPEGVDPVLHPDARIILTQSRRGNPHMAHAAMGRGRRQPDDIEQRAAADGDDVRVPINVMLLDLRLDFGNVEVGILGPLAAFEDERRADQFQVRRMKREIRLDVRQQAWLALGQGFIHHHQRLGHSIGFLGPEHLMEQRILRRKDAAREMHAMAVAHLNVPFNVGHGVQLRFFDAPRPDLFCRAGEFCFPRRVSVRLPPCQGRRYRRAESKRMPTALCARWRT